MRPGKIDADDTVRLRVPREQQRRARALPWALAALVFAGCGGGAYWAFAPGPAPSTVAPPAPAPLANDPSVITKPSILAGPSAYLPRLADEAEILADAPADLAVYRFRQRPSVVVLQFPSLAEQALTLNRVAALVEKSGFPHDRVVPRQQLDASIIAAGGQPDTFYFGHDYAAADLIRFSRLAVDANAQETRLRDLVRRLGWDESSAPAALISLVRGADAQGSAAGGLDDAGRVTILRHELSHGFYFTDPAYAEHCRVFWRDVLSAGERDRFTSFLGRDGYDTSLPDLMINETQAYLMHTPDVRFFDPAAVGISPVRIAELRQIFLVGMPAGWLRDTATVLP